MKDKKTGTLSRRDFMNRLIASGIVIGGVSLFGKQILASENNNPVRRFHISLQAEAWKMNPELLGLMKEAGITDVWMASYLQGKWFHTAKELKESADFLESKGF
jgi:hypothetical protein